MVPSKEGRIPSNRCRIFDFDIDSAKRRRIPPEDGGSSTSIFTNDAFWRAQHQIIPH